MAWLLDTNIVSELRKGEKRDVAVAKWYESIPEDELFLSVLILGELRRGVEIIRRRDRTSAGRLERWLGQIKNRFGNRILPVSVEIADLWGRLSPTQRLPDVDGLLAATAVHHKLTLATRNTRDIARSGAKCFDPFLP